jgi:hypothetical protein
MTKEPSTKATEASPRKRDGKPFGCRGELEEKGILTDHRSLELPRMEPLVIGLFGPPGSGKTTLLTKMISRLKEFFQMSGFKDEDFVYFRNPHTDHWDGYRGQCVTVMDDFAQDAQTCPDLVQFDQIVSSAEYVLPMADLSEKGQKFTSSVILLTSNLKFGQSVFVPSGPVVRQVSSVWRRIHLPYSIISKEDPTRDVLNSEHEVVFKARRREIFRLIPDYTLQRSQWDNHWQNGMTSDSDSSEYGRASLRFESRPCSEHSLIGDMVSAVTHHQDQKFSEKGIWYQQICSGEWDVKYPIPSITPPRTNKAIFRDCLFPSTPENISPSCKVVGIPEPLKVRVITAGSAEARCLKPLQLAMHKALVSYPEFSLTGSSQESGLSIFESSKKQLEAIEREMRTVCNRYPGRKYKMLSGDYKGATDAFFMEVTKTLLESILESISHEPTKVWARWELDSKELRYPDGVCDYQTRGQLMGSILSFPLLCLANKALCLMSGFPRDSFIINGDDLFAKVEEEKIQNWFRLGGEVGLTPTVGKTYVDEEFGTLNSQLFFRQWGTIPPSLEEELSVEGDLLHTGKLTLIPREGKILGETYRELQKLFPECPSPLLREIYISSNSRNLRQLVSSLNVSYRWGGLGQRFSGRYDEKLAKQVYFVNLYRRCAAKSLPIPGSSYHFLSIPVSTGIGTPLTPERLQYLETHTAVRECSLVNRFRALRGMDPEVNEVEELTRSQFEQSWKKLSALCPALQDVCGDKGVRLSSLPPLDTFLRGYAMVRSSRLTEAKKVIVDHLFGEVEFHKRLPLSDDDFDPCFDLPLEGAQIWDHLSTFLPVEDKDTVLEVLKMSEFLHPQVGVQLDEELLQLPILLREDIFPRPGRDL